MRRSNMMCLALPMMPLMAVARMGRSAWSCGSRGMSMAPRAGAEFGSLRTLEGRSLTLDLTQGLVGGARVVKADVLCVNGVIHVIDSVLLPS